MVEVDGRADAGALDVGIDDAGRTAVADVERARASSCADLDEARRDAATVGDGQRALGACISADANLAVGLERRARAIHRDGGLAAQFADRDLQTARDRAALGDVDRRRAAGAAGNDEGSARARGDRTAVRDRGLARSRNAVTSHVDTATAR